MRQWPRWSPDQLPGKPSAGMMLRGGSNTISFDGGLAVGRSEVADLAAALEEDRT